jgi:hypothetical protein
METSPTVLDYETTEPRDTKKLPFCFNLFLSLSPFFFFFYFNREKRDF